jgi:hypothetical protein
MIYLEPGHKLTQEFVALHDALLPKKKNSKKSR